MKVFDTGIMVGRFQHIHAGHEKLINLGLTVCDKFLVFIGSAQESKTEKNPFNVEYRKELISKIYYKEIEEGKLIIKPLNDFQDKFELTPRWGEYVLNESKKHLDTFPELIIYGKDKDIFKCFDKEVVKNITEILVDRNVLNISATQIREYILNDNKEEWKKSVNEKLHSEYENLRKILMQVYCKKK